MRSSSAVAVLPRPWARKLTSLHRFAVSMESRSLAQRPSAAAETRQRWSREGETGVFARVDLSFQVHRFCREDHSYQGRFRPHRDFKGHSTETNTRPLLGWV